MTTQQAANLKSARNLAAERVSVSVQSTSQIPYEKREAYVTTLSEIILQYPARFDAQTVANARAELGDTPNPELDSYGFGSAVYDFTAELGDQAISIGESVASVGEGVKTTLNLTRWLIPIAALLALAIFFTAHARKSGAIK